MMLSRKFNIAYSMPMFAGVDTRRYFLWFSTKFYRITHFGAGCFSYYGICYVALTGLHAERDGSLLKIGRHFRRRDVVAPYNICDYGKDNDNQWQSGDRFEQGPTDKKNDYIPHDPGSAWWIPWVLLLCIGGMGFLFIDGGFWLFRYLYVLLNLRIIPVAQRIFVPLDIWAYQHNPVVLTGLIPLATGFLLTAMHAFPWVFGFGTTYLFVRILYRVTMRRFKLPSELERRQINKLRDKP